MELKFKVSETANSGGATTAAPDLLDIIMVSETANSGGATTQVGSGIKGGMVSETANSGGATTILIGISNIHKGVGNR